MKQVALNKILTPDQLEEVKRYIKKEVGMGKDPISTEFIKGLKELLGKYKETLAKKEVDSDYLAYAIANAEAQHLGLW